MVELKRVVGSNTMATPASVGTEIKNETQLIRLILEPPLADKTLICTWPQPPAQGERKNSDGDDDSSSAAVRW